MPALWGRLRHRPAPSWPASTAGQRRNAGRLGQPAAERLPTGVPSAPGAGGRDLCSAGRGELTDCGAPGRGSSSNPSRRPRTPSAFAICRWSRATGAEARAMDRSSPPVHGVESHLLSRRRSGAVPDYLCDVIFDVVECFDHPRCVGRGSSRRTLSMRMEHPALAPSNSSSTGLCGRPPPSRSSGRPRPRVFARRPRRSRRGAGIRPCSFASPSSTSRSWLAGQGERQDARADQRW